MKLWARGQALKPLPYPTNSDNEELPYGAVIDWTKWRVDQIPADQLIAFLRYRRVYIPHNCPVTEQDFNALKKQRQHCFGSCLHEQVTQVVTEDIHKPVPRSVGLGTGGGFVPWTKANVPEIRMKTQSVEILQAIAQLGIPSDEGLQRYQTSPQVIEHALKLFEGGNCYIETLFITEAIAKVTNRKLLLVNIQMLASQRSMTYHVIIAFDKATKAVYDDGCTYCSCPNGQVGCAHLMASFVVLHELRAFRNSVIEMLRQYDQVHKPCAWKTQLNAMLGTAVAETPQKHQRSQVPIHCAAASPITPCPRQSIRLAKKRHQKATAVNDSVQQQQLTDIEGTSSVNATSLKTPGKKQKNRQTAADQRVSVENRRKQFFFHGDITNEYRRSNMVEPARDPVLCTLVKYFPPAARDVAALSVPLNFLHRATRTTTNKGTSKKSNSTKTFILSRKDRKNANLMEEAAKLHDAQWEQLLQALEYNSDWKEQTVFDSDPMHIIDEQKRLVADLPRSDHRQYQCDLTYDRAFAEMEKGTIPVLSLTGHYITYTRKAVLQRMKAYEDKYPGRANVYVKPQLDTDRLPADNDVVPNDEMVANIVDDDLNEPLEVDAEDSVVDPCLDLSQLGGTWEVVPVGEVANETVVVRVQSDTLAAGQYMSNDNVIFAIEKKHNKICLIPNASRATKQRTTYVLDPTTSRVKLVWRQVCVNGLVVTWNRTCTTATRRMTRGDVNAQVVEVEKLTAKRKRPPEARAHRCCCQRPECRTMHELNHRQSSIPRVRRHEVQKVRRARRKGIELNKRWTTLFRAHFGVEANDQTRYFVNAQHWPKSFVEKYGHKSSQIPKCLPVAEAMELGMYVEGEPGCSPLLSRDKTTVVCIPWLRWRPARRQYEQVSMDSSQSRKAIRMTACAVPQDGETIVRELQKLIATLDTETKKGSANPAMAAWTDQLKAVAIAVTKLTAAFEHVKGKMQMLQEQNEQHQQEIKRLVNELRSAKQSGHLFTSEIFLQQNTEKCRRYFGFNSRTELIAMITKVFFPFLNHEPLKLTSESSHYKRVPPFQKACFALMFMKTGLSLSLLADMWGLPSSSCSKIVHQWCPLWAHVAKYFCRPTFDGEYLKRCQIDGNEERYGVPISHLNDGTVCYTETPRANTTMNRCMYSNKIDHAGTLALAHSTPSGLCLFATDTYAGNAQEIDLVRIHSKWWDAYPPGFGRLVDKGFAWVTDLYYKYGNKGIYPAFLTRDSKANSAAGTKQLTEVEARDATKQSQQRYVVETFFSRVKNFKLLKGLVKWGAIKFINDTYLTACAFANFSQPLQQPVQWQALSRDFEDAKELTRDTIRPPHEHMSITIGSQHPTRQSDFSEL